MNQLWSALPRARPGHHHRAGRWVACAVWL